MNASRVLAVCVVLLGAEHGFAQGIIITVAGGGRAPCLDGVKATAACLFDPSGITVAPDGTRYIADSVNHRIRKVTSGGLITTVAGNGTAAFAGDGGQAVAASLNRPTSVAVDPNGVLYIMDGNNNRIRRVGRDGIISTIAGDGTFGFTGDGGPATAARIALGLRTAGITWTASGLYFTDTGNSRIRRIDPTGVINTIAGGTAGFAGDGGPATAARLNSPSGPPVFDSAGSLYFADTANDRIRRITPVGIISTFAGSTAGFSGDGGPAISASLRDPLGVVLAPDGSFFIADTGNSRVRRVTPDGIIRTVAGGGNLIADGSLSTDIALTSPRAVAADRLGVLIVEAGADKVRLLLGSYATLGTVSVSPNAVDFKAARGGDSPDRVAVSLQSPELSAFGFSARASTSAGGNWLSVSPATGLVPSTLTISANTAGLAAGRYLGTVSIAVPQARNSPVAVQVTLTVEDRPAALSVAPTQMFFSTVQGSNPPEQALRIANAGGGTLSWTVAALSTATSAAGNWLALSPTQGTGQGAVRVTANAARLAAGFYQAVIVVRSGSGETQRVPVTLQVTQAAAVLQIGQTGLLFSAVEGSGELPAQSFGVANAGAGTMNWSAEVRSIVGGNWLALSPAAGSSGGQTPASLTLTANATGLPAGTYHAVLKIAASGAANSPQFANVVLAVAPANSASAPVVSPSGLLFVASAGGGSPAAQSVRVSSGSSTAARFTASATELNDDGWLSVSAASTSASAVTAGTLSVSVDPSGLATGVYQGLVNVSFADGTSRSVNVLLVVAPAGAGAASATEAPAGAAPELSAACTPARLAIVHTGVASNFNAPVGWPVPLLVRVVDDCGTSQATAGVVTTFSNGDAPVAMTNLRNGQYAGTWTPASSASSVTITTTATVAGLQQGSSQIRGAVAANTVPQVNQGGIVHAASYAPGAPLAPGSIISIFGSNLTSGVASATAVPLPRELGSLSATAGNYEVPLYFTSGGQVNAQLPFELPVNSTAQLVVRAGNAYTVPQTIQVAAAQPGVFTENGAGTGLGSILDVNYNRVAANNPVRAGDVIQMFCAGLGETQPAVPSGESTPATPLANVLNTVTATIDGIAAPVLFAGLAPNFVGLYQVNVQVPQGVRAGEVPVVLTQGDVVANTVTIFVRQ